MTDEQPKADHEKDQDQPVEAPEEESGAGYGNNAGPQGEQKD
ncbi:hypothetical protein [Sphingomonas abaci]|uniref:Uncharacterized protein n=1 Tax=Sphingomonas abaci TaxID=237611 RepID=A0A7W7AKU9_9SPHN|nr:hypothetical protein [Sphingomonas abaci]MBB4617877.1 hypothetical protein [Sphingomonas abaci]